MIIPKDCIIYRIKIFKYLKWNSIMINLPLILLSVGMLEATSLFSNDSIKTVPFVVSNLSNENIISNVNSTQVLNT